VLTITVANQKGGVAKSTTAVTLGHGLARNHYNTLVLDLDPQGVCAPLLRMDQGQNVFNFLVHHPPLQEVALSTGRDGLWLMPGNKLTQAVSAVASAKGQAAEEILSDALDTNKIGAETLHYLVLDTAPTVGDLQVSALAAADILIMPCALDQLSLRGVTEILSTLASLKRNEPPLGYVLPTFFDDVTKESRANLELLREHFAGSVLKPIHRATVFRECAALGATIFEHAPKSRAAVEYDLLVRTVLDG